MTILFLVLTKVVAGQMAAAKNTFSRYMFDQVLITGETNVNDFHLEYRENEFCNVLGKLESGSSTIQIEIPADQVEADSQVMLNDFLKLINADQYPNITIGIDRNEIEFFAVPESGEKLISLSMNGISKQFYCSTLSESCFGNQWCLTGQLQIRLTDFNIEPPHKFLGLVKVQNEIFINFRILFS